MKKRLLFSIIAILLTFLMIGCDTTDKGATSSDNASDASTSSSKESQTSTEQPNKASEALDFSKYHGTWAEEGIDWSTGGLIIDIYYLEQELLITCTNTQAAPLSRIAQVEGDVLLSNIEGNVVTFDYDDDGWGNKGTVVLTLDDNKIWCEIKNVEYDEMAFWALYDGTYSVIRNDSAHDSMAYDMDLEASQTEQQGGDDTSICTADGLLTVSETSIDMQNDAVLYITLSYDSSVSWYCDSQIITMRWGEWDACGTIPLYITGIQNGSTVLRISDANYPDEYIEVNVTVSGLATIGATNASGILAELGMTEEEFKANCTYIGSRSDNYKNEYAYSAGRNYYAENPQDDTPKKYAEYWQDYLINGSSSVHYTIERERSFELAKDLEDFLDITVYGPKGASILGRNSEAIAEDMREYPDNYIGKAYLLKDFFADNINNYIYSCDWFLGNGIPFTIYDYRDNVNSPTVLENTEYDMYVVFLGNYMQYNKVGLEFALIALEKVE